MLDELLAVGDDFGGESLIADHALLADLKLAFEGQVAFLVLFVLAMQTGIILFNF